MQNTIRSLFILLAFFITIKSYSQVFYYSGGKKITLSSDKTSVFINIDKSDADQPFLNYLMKIDGIQALENTNNRNVIKVRLSADVNKNKVFTNLKSNSKVLHAWEAYDLNGTPFIPTGEILFKMREGVSEKEILRKLNLGSKLVVSSQKGFDFSIYNVTDSNALFDISNLIYESDLVEWCHPNFFVPITTFTNDPLWAQQYYLRNTGQLGGVAGIDINVEGAWNLTRGANVRVAVIDEGVEDHEDLGGRVLNGFTPRNVNGNGRPIITGAHGESTAGIIAATQDNGIGISGIAPQSQIVPINIFAGGETALDIANGINWAWNQGHADVISNSWGYNTASQTQPNFDAIIQAITNARTQGRVGRGSIVVFASGNNFGNGVDDVSFPANVNGVITVGACNNAAPAGAIWNYSERGASMDLVAPSGNINLNGDLTTLDRMGNLGYELGNYTNRFGGTSAACPQVSGIAALMLSANANLTETQVRTILQTTATDMGTAGFDNTFGFGRANGCAAVRAAITSSTISGIDPLCLGTSQYSINGINGAAITWSTSNPSIATVTPNGNPTTVTKTGNGWITLTATINSTCGNSVVFQRQIRVGVYSTSDYNMTQWPSPVCANGTFQVGMPWYYTPPAPNTTYNWYYGNGVSYISGQGTNVVTLKLNPGASSPWVMGRANNNCGQGPFQTITVSVNPYCTSSFTVSPNPSSDVINIEPNNDPAARAILTRPPEVMQVELTDKMGSVRYKQKFGKAATRATINVSNLPSDIYTLRIFDGQIWFTHKVSIRH